MNYMKKVFTWTDSNTKMFIEGNILVFSKRTGQGSFFFYSNRNVIERDWKSSNVIVINNCVAINASTILFYRAV